MTTSFHPAADWPSELPSAAGAIDVGAARFEAHRRIVWDLPVASRLYAVVDWVEAAPLDQFLGELMRSVLAADCWSARVPCPRRGLTGPAWERYFQRRLESIRSLLSAALARWAVLERIPVRWIPAESVRAEIHATASRAGFPAEAVEIDLIPPTTGGSEWVVRDFGHSAGSWTDSARLGPVAAVLHWPDRTAAAIVTAEDDVFRAFGSSFGPEGLVFDAAELVCAAVVRPAEPPVSFLHRCAHALGLGELVWRWTRSRRLRLGGHPRAAL